MKILKIDHLGIAVNNMAEGKDFWSEVLGLKFEGAETVAEQKVTTAFFPVGESEVSWNQPRPMGRSPNSSKKRAPASNMWHSGWKTSKKPWQSSRLREFS